MESNQKLLYKEINDRIKFLEGNVPGNTEDKNQLASINALLEAEKTAAQIRNERIDTFRKIGADVMDICVKSLGVILPLYFYSKWQLWGYGYEKNGYVSSTTFKGVLHNIAPKK